MNTYNELRDAIEKQANEIRNILASEIECGRFQIMSNDNGDPLAVEEIVRIQFFQENDLVECFLHAAGDQPFRDFPCSLEDLRDLQHGAVMSLYDIIEKNQQFREDLTREIEAQKLA